MNTKTLEIKAGKDAGKNSFSCVMSCEIADRDGEVVILSGVDISEFSKNPVLMYDHGKDFEQGKLPVGRVEAVEIEGMNLKGECVYAERPGSHPEGEEWLPDTLHSLMQQKCINAVSMGFIVDEIKAATAEDRKKYGAGAKYLLTKTRLVELSVVSIPANQEALITAVSKGLAPKNSKAWDGEVVVPATEQKAKTIIEIKPKKNHIVVLKKSIHERVAEHAIVRIKGGLYA